MELIVGTMEMLMLEIGTLVNQLDAVSNPYATIQMRNIMKMVLEGSVRNCSYQYLLFLQGMFRKRITGNGIHTRPLRLPMEPVFNSTTMETHTMERLKTIIGTVTGSIHGPMVMSTRVSGGMEFVMGRV